MRTTLREKTSIAAFFDVDGTLVPRPSLEQRFFAELRKRQAIPVGNYLFLLMRAARLVPGGIAAIMNENKMYLRGVAIAQIETAATSAPPAHQGSRSLLLDEAVERVAWHAAQGHAIVLASGTLAPLARNVAVMLGMRLALHGRSGSIHVCATELEERDGRWTGEIAGGARWGEGKARAVRRFAREHGIELNKSYAYGDSMSDRPMLEAVGRPATVNPPQELHRIARRRDWPIFWWRERKDSPQSGQSAQRRQEIWGNLG